MAKQTEAEARQAANDEALNAELVEMADGTGRLQRYLEKNPGARAAAERHRQRQIAKGTPGW